ncbi:MAG: histidine phosphatase family protein [Hoeflea sp.]|uniref:histidine phosphatase family protein n=1 Tax=Hoeflea sp. TaxID=1940281 RepID=UPI000C112442|nr:histidine phosphatase family protein [Hoeflea sp.]PHR22972.1 MAG: histidine phosphatase family protein [Hoeflea sp.]|tara:strand:- start:16676 stop:17266 length:591 start_codon:yes stop_codon:yes gene_type:complete
MLLYVIRHGQTDYNREVRLQGARDIPLNDIGRGQATGNGEFIAALTSLELPLDEFDWVASPLGRTRETMERIRTAAGLDPLAYRTDPLLVELSFGDWEGQTLLEVEAHSPQLITERNDSKWHFRPPGDRSESYAMLAERTAKYLATVERPTICVAHGGVIRTLFHLIGKIDGDEAAVIDIPQDRVLKIDGDSIGWI